MTSKWVNGVLVSLGFFSILYVLVLDHTWQREKAVKAEIRHLQYTFPTQPRDTWRAVEDVLRPIAMGRAWYPGVLMMVTPPGSSLTGRCLGMHIRSICKALSTKEATAKCLPLVGLDYSLDSSGPTLYEHVEGELTRENAVFIQGIDDLSKSSILTLGSLISGERFHNPNVIFLLTASCKTPIGVDAKTGPVSHAYQCLSTAWRMHKDDIQVQFIMEWLTANSIRVLPEQKLVV